MRQRSFRTESLLTEHSHLRNALDPQSDLAAFAMFCRVESVNATGQTEVSFAELCKSSGQGVKVAGMIVFPNLETKNLRISELQCCKSLSPQTSPVKLHVQLFKTGTLDTSPHRCRCGKSGIQLRCRPGSGGACGSGLVGLDDVRMVVVQTGGLPS